MSGWNQIVDEVNAHPNGLDGVRSEKIDDYAAHVGRNVICYYSGWLQRQDPATAYLTQITDDDKHGFMNALHGMKPELGLDLILHCPGGDLAATESLIHYLRSKFGHDIRTIVPQISMSGGTMLAFCGSEIAMARHSNLGPIDPQLGEMSVMDILADWESARAEILANPAAGALWAPITSKYPLGFIQHCEAIKAWGIEIGTRALKEGMLRSDKNPAGKAAEIVNLFTSKQTHRSHARHLHREDCAAAGLNIVHIEDEQPYQDKLLSVHHAFMVSLSSANVAKVIENNLGNRKIIFL